MIRGVFQNFFFKFYFLCVGIDWKKRLVKRGSIGKSLEMFRELVIKVCTSSGKGKERADRKTLGRQNQKALKND